MCWVDSTFRGCNFPMLLEITPTGYRGEDWWERLSGRNCLGTAFPQHSWWFSALPTSPSPKPFMAPSAPSAVSLFPPSYLPSSRNCLTVFKCSLWQRCHQPRRAIWPGKYPTFHLCVITSHSGYLQVPACILLPTFGYCPLVLAISTKLERTRKSSDFAAQNYH